MSAALLKSAYLKLGRSDTHVRNLLSAGRDWVASRTEVPVTWTDSIEGRGKRQKRVARFDRVEPFPDEWGLIFGDAAHNVRSALDHLVCALALLNGSTNVNSNSFPIYPRKPEAARFERMETVMLGGLRDEHRDRILKMQPYLKKSPTRDRRLLTLGALDNVDKHQALTPARAVTNMMRGQKGKRIWVRQWTDEWKNPNIQYPNRITVEPGRKAWWCEPHSEVLRMPYLFAVVFGELRVSIDELREIQREVRGIIDGFSQAFDQ